MQCSHCRTENEDSAKFCASCGAPMQVAPPPVCPVCAHVNAAGANFCIACGAHLRRRRTMPEATPAASRVTSNGVKSSGVTSSAPRVDAAAARAAATASAAPPQAPISNPLPERARVAPDVGAMRRPDPVAAAASARHEDFEGAAIPPPRISGFELKAGLAVLVLVLGGGLLWWSNQNDSQLAQLALTAAAPASSALRTVAETTIGSPPPQEHRMESEAVAAPPVPPVAAAAPATPVPAAVTVPDAAPKVSETPPAPKTKTPASKHRSKSKREHEAEPAPVPVPARELPPVVELSEPASTPARVEKRRSSLRDQVASCRRLSLFEGERCLWRICDGKWGKDGCPSYN